MSLIGESEPNRGGKVDTESIQSRFQKIINSRLIVFCHSATLKGTGTSI